MGVAALIVVRLVGGIRRSAARTSAATTPGLVAKRSSGNSHATYYAKNIWPGFNTVTVALSASTPFVDVRIAKYSGLDLTNPLDVTASGSGKSTSPNSGTATTTKPVELLVGGGTTTGSFTAAGSGFTKRIITTPDADILEDRVVSTTGVTARRARRTT